jgi:hypothetical protein
MLAAAAVIAAADNILKAVGRGPVQAVQHLRMAAAADKLAAVVVDKLAAVVVDKPAAVVVDKATAVVVVDKVMAAVAAVAAVGRVMAADTTKPGSLTRGA